MDPNQNYTEPPQTPPLPSSPPPEPPVPPPQPPQPQPLNQPDQMPPPSFSSPETPPQYQTYQSEQKKTNGIAIAGLIFAFLLPLIGFILSIIGLNKANKSGGSGKGLSIAGIVISLIIMLLSIPILIVTYNGVQKRVEENKAHNASNSAIQASSAELGDVYNEKSGAYSIKLPKGWQALEAGNSDNPIVRFLVDTKNPQPTAGISQRKLESSETLEKLVIKKIAAFSETERSVITNQGKINVNGLRGYEITGGKASNAPYFYYLILVKGDLEYILYCTTPQALSNEYIRAFKASAQTFTIK